VTQRRGDPTPITADRYSRGVDTDPDVELLERPAPHPWEVLREHAHLTPVIALGGALGSLARWELARALPHDPGAFAWSTLWTNLSGSFLLGLLMALVLTVWSGTRYLRPFLGVGVLGGFTTFSTYLLDTRGLIAAGHSLLALVYVAATVVLGLLAVLAGLGLGRTLLGRRA
jgi:CrcB protein